MSEIEKCVFKAHLSLINSFTFSKHDILFLRLCGKVLIECDLSAIFVFHKMVILC